MKGGAVTVPAGAQVFKIHLPGQPGKLSGDQKLEA